MEGSGEGVEEGPEGTIEMVLAPQVYGMMTTMAMRVPKKQSRHVTNGDWAAEDTVMLVL